MHIQYPDKRVRRTKEGFKNALLSLMEVKHFEEITIVDIVKTADFNRGTFYAHYDKKEDLLDEIIEDMFDKMTEALRKPYKELSVVDLHNLSPSSIVLFDHFLENKKFYKIMSSPKTNYNFYEKFSKKLAIIFRNEFDLAVDMNDPNVDIQLFTTYRIHGIIGLITEWIHNDFDKSPAYMGEQLIHILRYYTPKIYIKSKKL